MMHPEKKSGISRKKIWKISLLMTDASFVNDERLKVGSFYSHSYPYTVDFEEEDELTELIQIHNWYPQASL